MHLFEHWPVAEDHLCKLSQLEELFRDDRIDEVVAIGREIFCTQSNGDHIGLDIELFDSRSLLRFVQDLSFSNGMVLDPKYPESGGILASGKRWHAVISPMAVDDVVFVMRRHRFESLDWLYYGQQQTQVCLDVLKCLERGKSLFVAGKTGVGKTSFLRALLQEIGSSKRGVVIESVAELRPNLPFWMHLLAPPGIARMMDVVHLALRLRPDMIVFGELRSRDEFAAFELAKETGHGSVLATMHGSDVSSRLLNCDDSVLMMRTRTDWELLTRIDETKKRAL